MSKPQDAKKDYVWGKRKSKMWIIITIVAVVVVVGVAGFVIFGLNPDDNSGSSSNTNSGSSALTRRAIDGVYVAADQANNFPVAVMVENLAQSRPPSGLSKAQVVYEALAEGGITRFMAIFAGKLNVPEIGPVRSARPYYLDWALEYNALYAHAGGSPEAISNIKKYNVFDLNQFYNSQYFWRDKTRNLPSEHTLYTSGEKLAFALRDLKAEKQGNYTPWRFKDDGGMSERPTIEKSLTIDFSSFNYKVEYKYDSATNAYVRYLAGQIHKDRDGAEIHAKNVVVQKVKTTLADEQRLSMETIGQGQAIIFRDGMAVTGRWEKKARADRTLFYAEDGQQIEFNAGTTWIEIVPTDRDIVYN